jgi:hypothetical protein
MLVAAGLFLLVSSTIVVGYGNYVKAKATEAGSVARIDGLRSSDGN